MNHSENVIWYDDLNTNGNNWESDLFRDGSVQWIQDNSACSDDSSCYSILSGRIKRMTDCTSYSNLGFSFDYYFQCTFSSGSSCYIDLDYACLTEDPNTLSSYPNVGWERIRGNKQNNLKHLTASFIMDSSCDNKPYVLLKISTEAAQIVYIDNIQLAENVSTSDYVNNNGSIIQTTQQSKTVFTNYEYYAWNGNTLECDDHIDCVVNCYGPTACDRVTIVGPAQASLTINCNSLFAGFNDFGQACPHITVYAENSTELHINAYNADHEFYTSNIYTPLSDTSETNTFITCGIVGEHNEDTETILSCGVGHNIYSENGWSSVEWKYTDGSSWSLTAMDDRYPVTMHCGEDYLESCRGWDVDGIFYRCSDRTSQCDYDRASVITTTSGIEITTSEASSTEDIYGVFGSNANSMSYKVSMIIAAVSSFCIGSM